MQVRKAFKVSKEYAVISDQKETLGVRAQKAISVRRVQKDQLALWDQSAHKEILVHKDLEVSLDLRDLLVQQALWVLKA